MLKHSKFLSFFVFWRLSKMNKLTILFLIVFSYITTSCDVRKDRFTNYEYIIENRSGVNLTMDVYFSATGNLKESVSLLNNGSHIVAKFFDKEQGALFFQFGGADSIVYKFSDNKLLVHKCILNKPVGNGCNVNRNIFNTIDKIEEQKTLKRVIYQISTVEYNSAQ